MRKLNYKKNKKNFDEIVDNDDVIDLSRRISVSKKIMNNQRVQLKIKDEFHTADLSWWIMNHSEIVYRHVYEPKLHNLNRLELTREGIYNLKQALIETNPTLFEKIKSKKRIIKAIKKANRIHYYKEINKSN